LLMKRKEYHGPMTTSPPPVRRLKLRAQGFCCGASRRDLWKSGSIVLPSGSAVSPHGRAPVPCNGQA